jgi:hypothetical protein
MVEDGRMHEGGNGTKPPPLIHGFRCLQHLQNNIKIGDLCKNPPQDKFVMINSIVTKLNSQLPDATIRINSPIEHVIQEN